MLKIQPCGHGKEEDSKSHTTVNKAIRKHYVYRQGELPWLFHANTNLNKKVWEKYRGNTGINKIIIAKWHEKNILLSIHTGLWKHSNTYSCPFHIVIGGRMQNLSSSNNLFGILCALNLLPTARFFSIHRQVSYRWTL